MESNLLEESGEKLPRLREGQECSVSGTCGKFGDPGVDDARGMFIEEFLRIWGLATSGEVRERGAEWLPVCHQPGFVLLYRWPIHPGLSY